MIPLPKYRGENQEFFEVKDTGYIAGDVLNDLEDALALDGVKRHSAGIKCALLAWDCIDRGLVEGDASVSLREEMPKEARQIVPRGAQTDGGRSTVAAC
ncbi:MAG: hypothetical protein EBZ48_15965 [Proteobacteria bacterium]|nr:hypothetical protein [Pseudomonadota bacterium]